MLVVPSHSLSTTQSLDSCLSTLSPHTHTHIQQRVVCEWNLSETKVLARLSCAACSSRFMGEITSFTPSSTVPAERKHSHPLPPWPHATVWTTVSCFLSRVSVFSFSCVSGDKWAGLTGECKSWNWIYWYCVYWVRRRQTYISLWKCPFAWCHIIWRKLQFEQLWKNPVWLSRPHY